MLPAAGLVVPAQVLGASAARAAANCPASGGTAETAINGTSVPLSQLIEQYAGNAGPELQAAIDQSVLPVTVLVGSEQLVLTPVAGCGGVLSGTSTTGLVATLHYNWMSAAKALTYAVDVTNPTNAAIANVRVEPFHMQLKPGSALPCTKYAEGSDKSLKDVDTFTAKTASFTSPTVPAVDINGAGSATTTPILDVALDTGSKPCDSVTPSRMSGFYVGFGWSTYWQYHAGWVTPTAGSRFDVAADTPNQATPTTNAFPDSRFTVAAGQTLTARAVHLGFFSGTTWQDLDQAQKKYVATQLRPARSGTLFPVTYDSWFGLGGADNAQILHDEATKAAALGVEDFTIDAGWYSGWSTLNPMGNWITPDRGKYWRPNQMQDLCSYVRSLNMGCGMWLLLQEAASGTDGLTKWNITTPQPQCPNVAVPHYPAGTTQSDIYGPDAKALAGYTLQLQNPAAATWAEYMASCDIEAYGLSWLRFETITIGQYQTSTADTAGIAYGRNVYKIIDDLRAKYPSVTVEASQSGGGRMDFGMVSRSDQNWLRDGVYDQTSGRISQMKALRIWPANYLALSDIVCSSWDTSPSAGCDPATAGTAFAAISHMPGRLTFDGDLAGLSDTQTAAVRAAVAAYKQVRDLQDQPAYFPLPEADSAQPWDAVVYGSGATSSQLMYTFRGTTTAPSTTFTPPAGPAGSWTLVTYSGGTPTLTTNGATVTVGQDANSAAVWRRDPISTTTVAAPSNVSAVQQAGTINVTWTTTASTPLDNVVERSSDGTTWTAAGTVAGTASSFADYDVQPGASYSYRVSTQLAGGLSSTATATTATTGPIDVLSTLDTVVVDNVSPGASPGTFPERGTANAPHGLVGADTVASANVTNDATTYTCAHCTEIDLLAQRDTGDGIANVSVDGGTATAVDLYASTHTDSDIVYRSAALPIGDHTITVTVSGTKNPASSGTWVDVDGYAVRELTPNTTTIDDSSPSIAWSAAYRYFTGRPNSTTGPSGFIGGDAHSSTTVGDTMTYTCTACSGITWLAHKGPGYGIGTISVDGGTAVNVDEYAPSTTPTGPVWTSPPLPPVKHTFVITTTGQKNPANTSTTHWVEVDALQTPHDGISAGSPTSATNPQLVLTPTSYPGVYVVNGSGWSASAAATITPLKPATGHVCATAADTIANGHCVASGPTWQATTAATGDLGPMLLVVPNYTTQIVVSQGAASTQLSVS